MINSRKLVPPQRMLCLIGLVLLAACSAGGTPAVSPTPASTPTPPVPPAAAEPGTVWLSPIDEMALVFIPAGPFLMGAADQDANADSTEQPQRPVSLDAFWIDQTEVTNGMYALCVSEASCEAPQFDATLTRSAYFNDLSFGEYPVVNVTWEQAGRYCSWAGRRLPTEAEWEKAARGEQGLLFPWGDQAPDCDRLNFANEGPGRGACAEDTIRVGNFPGGASPYGALDMAGNVGEWVADWYSPDAYADQAEANPAGPASGQSRVVRGGSFSDIEKTVRTSHRHQTHPENASYFIGFRCALSAAP